MNAPAITSVRFYSKPTRKKPREGDRRVTKKNGLEIRVRVLVHDHIGTPIGYMANNGRPTYEWRKPEHLAKRDWHLLTIEEQKRFFPPESEPGYMQQRGAA